MLFGGKGEENKFGKIGRKGRGTRNRRTYFVDIWQKAIAAPGMIVGTEEEVERRY